MSILELITRKLTPKVAGYQAGTGGEPEYIREELAGMLAGLPSGAQHLAWAKFAGDPQAARRLYAALHIVAADWARQEQWEIKRGSAWLYLLALMVRDDLIMTRPLMGRKQAARWMSQEEAITEWQWRGVWKDRHHRLLDVGLEWEWMVARKLGKEIYSDRYLRG